MSKSASRSPLDLDGHVAVLGFGRMGNVLTEGFVDSGTLEPSSIVATFGSQDPRRDEDLDHRFPGIRRAASNVEAVRGASLVLLCVKPQMLPAVLDEIRGELRRDQLVLSIVAGWSTRAIERKLGVEVPVVRAMPNTPSRIRSGMTALCGGTLAVAEQLEMARHLFLPVGRCLVLEEKHMDAVTGLSASGPAFIYIVIEALAEGGVKVGLPRDVATELAAQTCLGAAGMVLETGDHPARLKDEVTTPAGCTIDGILKLEEGGLRVTLIKAIVEAARRAGELGE